MPSPGLDFNDPASIKNWAIQLANACGGSQIYFGKVKAPNAEKANALLDEFAIAFDTQLVGGNKNAESGAEEE
jgi:hypothetical protein